MERSGDASAEVVTLQLDPAEVLALYGILALGAHFAAVISGEDSPFSPDEIRSHIATIGETASDTLMAKLVEAGTAVHASASAVIGYALQIYVQEIQLAFRYPRLRYRPLDDGSLCFRGGKGSRTGLRPQLGEDRLQGADAR